MACCKIIEVFLVAVGAVQHSLFSAWQLGLCSLYAVLQNPNFTALLFLFLEQNIYVRAPTCFQTVPNLVLSPDLNSRHF